MTRVCNYDGCTEPASHARELTYISGHPDEFWFCQNHDPLADERVAAHWSEAIDDGE